VSVEFVDPGEDVGGPQTPIEAIGPEGMERRPLVALDRDVAGAVLFLTAAAALAAVAAFQTLYTVTLIPRGSIGYSVDAWGRYRYANVSATSPRGAHEARYGILLCGCAAVFGAVAILAAMRRARGSAAIAAGCAACGLAGVLAAIGLQLNSVADSVRAAANADTELLVAGRNPALGVGAAVWLGLAALVAAGLAVLACQRLRLDKPRSLAG
jgi:hypothetical protein